MKAIVRSILITAALWSVTGAANATCQLMTVEVRNQLYDIRGLDAFCAEFEKLKGDVQTLMQKLAALQRENDALRAALETRPLPRTAKVSVRQ